MKKILFYLSFLIGITCLFVVLFFNQKKNIVPKEKIESKISSPLVEFYNSQNKKIASFKVEIARTPEEHKKGLMNRNYLAKDKGMLFIFSQQKPLAFWMKNTLIPLDMIFISQDKEIISITHNAQPCHQSHCPSYYSHGQAKYVLEINGGLTAQSKIIKGLKMKIIDPSSSTGYN